ncbi:MAG: outer membrane beta-barrel protein [Terriglobia bacterium]
MWKRSVLVMFFVGLAGAGAEFARAQANVPKVEIYGGVTKLWGRANGSKFNDGGGEVSVTGYFNRFVGFEGNFDEFSYTPPDAPAYGSHFSLLFGPHFTYRRNPWVNPFAHVLVGFTRGDANGPFFTVINRSAFTFGVGGGVDIKIWRILWLRPIQADYLRESFPGDPNPPFPFSHGLENNLRLSAGVVIRFGTFRRR